ncbi:thiosulfate sulfurtransferase, partial [mine drainage metagenome]
GRDVKVAGRWQAEHPILLRVDELQDRLEDPTLVLFDCRFRLQDPAWGQRVSASAHLPGARHADLERVLSGPVTPVSGRHPLPDPAVFARWLADQGVDHQTTLVAYDETSGPFATRLWWLARWIGLRKVSVLDGGIQAWRRQGGAVDSEMPVLRPGHLKPAPDDRLWVSTRTVESIVAGRDRGIILDARQAARYLGQEEPIDRVAGHIPGARNLCYLDTLTPEGTFKSPAELCRSFAECLGEFSPERVIHSCGSGVTACHTLFAMELAGLSGSRLYAGSYSEWIRDGTHRVETGSIGR